MMKTIWKAALGVTALGMLSACVPYDGYYEGSYYSGGGVGFGGGWGYCDGFGCPDDYWDRPLYYGSVFYGGRWNNGPFYYRDFNGGRQYWLGGGWRNDDWRGPRPQQYRNDRYGPALGRDWYRDNRPGLGGNRPGFNQAPRGGDNNIGPRGGSPGRNQAEIQQNRALPSGPPPDRFGRDRAAPPPPPREPQTSRGRGRSSE